MEARGNAGEGGWTLKSSEWALVIDSVRMEVCTEGEGEGEVVGCRMRHGNPGETIGSTGNLAGGLSSQRWSYCDFRNVAEVWECRFHFPVWQYRKTK